MSHKRDTLPKTLKLGPVSPVLRPHPHVSYVHECHSPRLCSNSNMFTSLHQNGVNGLCTGGKFSLLGAVVAMNIFSLGPLYRILSLIKGIFSFIFRIVFRRKKKLDKDDGRVDNDNPIEIISIDQSGNRNSSLLEERKGEMNVRNLCYVCSFSITANNFSKQELITFDTDAIRVDSTNVTLR